MSESRGGNPGEAPRADPAGAGRPACCGRAAAGDACLYALLLLLVWGLTAPLHGLWQDDAALLATALARRGQGLAGIFFPAGSPLRRLYELPFFLALATPHPVLALQAIYGACWLGQALAAGWIAGTLLPRSPLTRLLVVALTLTATGDYLTDSLTAVGYAFGVLTMLLAAGCGLSFVRRGGAGRCLGAVGLLAASLWTIDVAVPALAFLPFLVGWPADGTDGTRWRRRLPALLLAWGAVALPVALLEWRLLHDPRTYSARVLLPLPPGQIAYRAAALGWENFAPWRWAFSHPIWYPRPPAVLPAGAMACGAVLAVAALALRLRRLPPEPPPAPAARPLGLALFFALMALAANAAYATVRLSEIHYRTHLASRVWASLALGTAVAWAAARWPRLRLGVLAVPALFVGLGVWGGLERQDFFLATWRQHQRELSSIVTSAPEMRPGTGLILRGDAAPAAFLATQVEYLTHAWMVLLYGQPSIHCLKISPSRGAGCQPAPRGLDCWQEGRAACFAAHTCAPDHFDYDRLIVMDFDRGAGVYRLRTSLAGDPLAAGAEAAAAAYRPSQRICAGELSAAQRRLLLLY